MILTEIALNGIPEIIDTPFVSSIIPENIPVANDAGRCRVSKIGDNVIVKISNTLLFSNIERITLNSITKPPIISIVFIELIILF